MRSSRYALPSLILLACLAPLGAAGAQTLSLDDIQTERLGIQLAPVSQAESLPLAELPAMVVRARSDLSSVVTPFSGVVTEISVLPGDVIETGDTVAVIESRDFSDTQAQLTSARADARAAAQSLERTRQLVEAGIAAREQLEMAEARATAANAMVRDLTSRLPANVTTGANGQSRIIVRARTDGKVDAVSVRVGDTVEAQSSLAMLSAGSALWAEIQVPARLVGTVKTGGEVLFPSGETGQIVSSSGTIDPMTRSATAYAEIPAGLPVYRGELIQVSLQASAPGASLTSIPIAGLVRLGEGEVVFRQRAGGFEAVPVRSVSRSSREAVVEGDLAPGDVIAVRGLSELKVLAMEELG